MLVAIVTAPSCPACSTMWASRSWFFAFSTSCSTPRRVSSLDRYSDTSTEMVPTSTGWPISLRSSMSSATASNFSSAVLKMRSFSSTRTTATLVGIGTTSRP